jgi:hypothetical protein
MQLVFSQVAGNANHALGRLESQYNAVSIDMDPGRRYIARTQPATENHAPQASAFALKRKSHEYVGTVDSTPANPDPAGLRGRHRGVTKTDEQERYKSMTAHSRGPRGAYWDLPTIRMHSSLGRHLLMVSVAFFSTATARYTGCGDGSSHGFVGGCPRSMLPRGLCWRYRRYVRGTLNPN